MNAGTDLRGTSRAPSAAPWRVADDVLSRAVDGEAVLLELQSGRYFGLDEIGSRIWSLLAAGRPLAEISAALLAEYDVTAERIETDLARFVARLSELGLVTAEPAEAPARGAAE